MKDLALKATALSELNLPVKVTWGQLGRLVLKIPWKNIYKEPVIVNIEDLLILVSPESDIVYIPEREEKWAQDAKQAELARVEEAKKRAAEKGGVIITQVDTIRVFGSRFAGVFDYPARE